MISSIILVSIAAIILRFDGSLRGANTPTTVASCASALLGNNGRLIAIGGRSISPLPSLSSGETEYDGLILGLEWVHQSATCGKLDRIWEEENRGDDDDDDDSETSSVTSTVHVLGDCKTVIDHLNGVATPRKLKRKYDRAVSLIDKIKAYAQETLGNNISVTFEHVPRENNVLCDALCSIVMSCQQNLSLCEVEYAITEGRLKSADSRIKFGLPTSKKSRYKFRKTHFSHAVSRADNVPIDKRLDVWRKLAQAALESGDAVALRVVGEKIRAKSNELSSDTIDLSTLGVAMEIHALRMLSLNKEVEQSECRYKQVLRFCDSVEDYILGFVANANENLSEITDSRISMTTSRIEDTEWREWIRDWCSGLQSEPASLVDGLESGVWNERLHFENF